VNELDKTAQRSLARRKATAEQLVADKKELAYLDAEIAELKKTYDPFCAELEGKIQLRVATLKQLDACLKHQAEIIGLSKSTVRTRMQDDSRLTRKMATQQLAVERGFDLGPTSTFRQGTRNVLGSSTSGSSSVGGKANTLAPSASTSALGGSGTNYGLQPSKSAPKL
jgi:hypothetical protein